MSSEINQIWGETIVAALAGAGVETVTVAPGSRSTPLVMAVHGHPDIRTVVQLDERSAAFFALGVGKATGRPAAVLTTSGTAVANLMPALVEADASETPLIALTADRPARLRGADANQTIDQIRLFGARVRQAIDVPAPSLDEDDLRNLAHVVARGVALARGPVPGPVHVNVPFAKPLEPANLGGRSGPHAAHAAPAVSVTEPLLALRPEDLASLEASLDATTRGLIVAGPARPGQESVALRLGRALGYPILADPLSGARYPGPGSHGVPIVGTYDLALRARDLWEGLSPDHIVRIGASPTSAILLQFLESLGHVDQTVIDPGGRWKDHQSLATTYYRCDGGWLSGVLEKAQLPGANAGWNETWLSLEARTVEALESALEGDPFEGMAISNAIRGLDSPSTVMISNSMPIRDMDTFVSTSSEPLATIGNRGASGIDGVVSTAMGAAWAQPGASNLALLGDLALLHDSNGLLAAREGLSLVILVINNDGGGIFHMLPIRDHEPAFTTYFATPHGRDFRHLAALYDIPFTRVSPEGVEEAVRTAVMDGGVQLVETRTDRDRSHQRRRQLVDDVVARILAG